MKKIVVVGSSNTDLIIKVPEIPRPGETVLGGEFSTVQGGKGANQAVAASRAGGDVMFISAVGDDTYGEEAVRGYRLDHIDTRHMKICKHTPSGVAMITVSGEGENSIAVASGANALLEPGDLDDAGEAFEGAAVMLIQLEIPVGTVARAVELCRELNIRVILNPAPAAKLSDGLLAGVDIITPNESETEKLTGIAVRGEGDALEASKVLHRKGIPTVIITMGQTGAFLSDDPSGLRKLIRGFSVEAVDSTAAGDVFNGQLAVALTEGKSLKEAVVLANAAAALSVQKLGAQSSIPRRKETNDFLEEQTKNDSK